MLGSLVHRRAVRELQKFVPGLEVGDVSRGPAGVRAQAMSTSPFQKRTLSGNVVGSIAVSDHKTIRNNFYKIIFPQKLGEVLKLDPPIFTTPYYNAQN